MVGTGTGWAPAAHRHRQRCLAGQVDERGRQRGPPGLFAGALRPTRAGLLRGAGQLVEGGEPVEGHAREADTGGQQLGEGGDVAGQAYAGLVPRLGQVAGHRHGLLDGGVGPDRAVAQGHRAERLGAAGHQAQLVEGGDGVPGAQLAGVDGVVLERLVGDGAVLVADQAVGGDGGGVEGDLGLGVLGHDRQRRGEPG